MEERKEREGVGRGAERTLWVDESCYVRDEGPLLKLKAAKLGALSSDHFCPVCCAVGASLDASPTVTVGDDKGLLSSLSLSRAFNLPFALGNRAVDAASPRGTLLFLMRRIPSEPRWYIMKRYVAHGAS